MDDIIRASGLSAGAVYGYFKGKDDLIVEALTTSLSDLRDLLAPMIERDPPPSEGELVRNIAQAILDFSARDSFDMRRIAIMGWGEAQRNERFRETLREFYFGFRGQLCDAVKALQHSGRIGRDVKADERSKALMAMVIGFVVQSEILGDVTPEQLATGLLDLTSQSA